MKKLIYVSTGIIILGGILFSIIRNKQEVEAKVYRYDREMKIPVKWDTVNYDNPDLISVYTGIFESNREVKIMADVQGKIENIFVQEGDKVRRGSPLVEIDNSLLIPELQSIDVTIEGLEKDVQRYSILADSGAIQEVKLEKAVLGLKSAKAKRSKISEQIRKTMLYAPFDGIITQKMTEVGSFAAPGMPLIQLIDIHKLKFTIQVPESELKYFRSDIENTIEVSAVADLIFTGEINMIGSKGSPAHSYPVQFIVDNTRDLAVKSGMYGSITIKQRQDNESNLSIPSRALIGSTLNPQVYIIQDGRAMIKDIKIDNQLGDDIIVLTGLQAGEIVITSGFVNLFDGAPVSLR